MKNMKLTTYSGLTRESFPQLRVLRSHADRASIQMALAHHDAARGDQRRGREAKFLRTQQAGDGNIAAGFQLTVGFNRDAAA